MDYLYRSDRHSALKRLRGLERVEDASTFNLLESLGISPGWKCLEIGAGAGSVAQWLDDRVGPSGRVVATDLEVEMLSDLATQSMSVLQHDLTVDELPQSTFDLVHARHILIHLGGDLTDHVLKMARTLKSGGWLMLEESDLTTNDADNRVCGESKRRYRYVLNKIHRLYQDRGMDLRLGSKLPDVMRSVGIVDIQSSQRCRTVGGGDKEAQFHKTTFSMLRDQLVSDGSISDSDFDAFLELHDDPMFSYKTRTTVSTWGRLCNTAA